MQITKAVNPRFEEFLYDWDYRTYLLVGGYGSSKSYHIAFKIILKCLTEVRKVLVVREVYDTIRESCFDLFLEILEDLDLLGESPREKNQKVLYRTSPMSLSFPNGSKIIFKGMDKPAKLKSINNISIIWIEECSELKYDGYKELLGRARHPTLSIHFILSTNPVGMENWVYTHVFKRVDRDGQQIVILDDERLYKMRTIVKNGVYYHHSTVDDNYFMPKSYTKTLDDMRSYDPDLYRIARWGRFGLNGLRVLPQFEVAETHEEVMNVVYGTPQRFLFNGFDFGFETSYNAIVRMAVDNERKYLYIYDEYYKNRMTDPETAKELTALGYKPEWTTGTNGRMILTYEGIPLVADCAEPKAIQYYKNEGFQIRACNKYAGSRLENTRKVKRFRKIICSPKCKNTIRELQTLTYAKDNNGNLIYDEFNIDPHTFSAIWYGLDNYNVANIKEIKRATVKGG